MKDARNLPQINLRLPPELKALIKQCSETNHRSINSEIVFALQQYYKTQAKPQETTSEKTT